MITKNEKIQKVLENESRKDLIELYYVLQKELKIKQFPGIPLSHEHENLDAEIDEILAERNEREELYIKHPDLLPDLIIEALSRRYCKKGEHFTYKLMNGKENTVHDIDSYNSCSRNRYGTFLFDLAPEDDVDLYLYVYEAVNYAFF